MGFKRLEHALTVGFRWYGDFVGSKPTAFVAFPLLITVLIAPGLFFMTVDDDVIMLFTPYSAPSRHEQEVVDEFSYVEPLVPVSAASPHRPSAADSDDGELRRRNNNLNQSGTTVTTTRERYLLQAAKNRSRANPWFFVDISYRNESNIMNTETFQSIWRIIHYLYTNYTCRVESANDRRVVRIVKYNPVYCNPNDTDGYECPPLDDQIAVLKTWLNQSADSPDTLKVRLTYPVLYFMGRAVNWGQFIYGAVTNESNGGHLESARVMALKLNFQFDQTEEDTYVARRCMQQMTDFFGSIGDDESCPSQFRDIHESGLTFSPCNQWLINDQVMEIKHKTTPCIAITAILVTIYTLVSSYYSKAPLLGAIEAVLGVFAIGLSLTATFAFLFACGLKFNFVTIMTPLLTLCVGIDNDFLLVSAWRRPHLDGLPARQRLAYAFAESGPSLTITSVNDILCFAVGCLSESPAISTFCLFTCIALTFRYLYQLTFFSGVLVLVSEKGPAMCERLERGLVRMRCRWRNPIKHLETLKATPAKWMTTTSTVTTGEQSATTSPSTVDVGQNDDPFHIRGHGDDHPMHKFFRETYSRFLSRRFVRVLIILLFAAYLSLAFYSTCRLTVNVAITKLFMDDSPLQEHYRVSQKYILTTMIGNVIVKKAPDFRNKTSIARFMEFVGNLERPQFPPTDIPALAHLPNVDDLAPLAYYSPKRTDTTVLWLKDYMEFRSFVSADSGADFYDYMSTFLQQPDGSKYINDLRFNYTRSNGEARNGDDRIRVESFAFSTYYQNVTTWDDSANVLKAWRRICANYSEYEAIVHDYFFRNEYLDQRLTLAGTTLQTMGIASACIAFVTGLLMPDMTSIFFICFSSFSVDLGVIGALNQWGSDLDPMTMACLLMTIGFSVYYTARICYCYQKVESTFTLERKLAFTLGSVGWPILQGGLATLVGIIPLAFVHSYMVRTFFRTIVLVVFVGLLHGLLFMPVLMSLYDRENGSLKMFAQKRREETRRQTTTTTAQNGQDRSAHWMNHVNWSVYCRKV